MNLFHYSFKIKDLPSTIAFYHTILGCEMGRSADSWVDFDFFGHQLSAHVSDNIPELDFCGKVDNVRVPIPHFGCILSDHQFDSIKARLEKASISFIIPPTMRYKGQVAEQRIMFLQDFSGNAIEFKCFSQENEVFTEKEIAD